MTLLFVDSFDSYATADISKRWPSPGVAIINAGTGRNGSQSFRMPSFASTVRASRLLPLTGTYIFGFACVISAFYTQASDVISLMDGNNTQIGLTVSPSGGLSVHTNTVGNPTLLGTASTGLSAGVWSYVEFKVTIHPTAGAVDVRINNQSVLHLTNVATRLSSSVNNYADSFQFGYVTGSSPVFDADDFYLCDNTGTVNNDFLGDVRIECLRPSGAGTTTQFTPSSGANYTTVNDATANTTNYVTSTADNQIDTYAFGDLSESSGIIKAVQVSAYAEKTDVGSKSLALVDRTNATNHVGPDHALSTSWGIISDILETDSGNGGVAWTIASVNGAEFGVKDRP